MIGEQFEVTVDAMAHGGHGVARHEGRVVFVRHALPTEQVRVVVTKGRDRDRFVFADAVEVLEPSPHRVTPPCRFAGPGGCGGCDFQHVDLPYQRTIKAGIVAEQLERLAGIDWRGEVQPVPGDEEGLRWRTRVEFAVRRNGRTGLHRYHSHDVIDIDDCLIARPEIIDTGVLEQRFPGARAVDVISPSTTHDPVVVEVPAGLPRTPDIVEHVHTPTWDADVRLNARGFWQVHPGAAATFVSRVLAELDPQPGERALDLYAGVGLFARALADAVGDEGAVLAVESDTRAVEVAMRDLADREEIEFRAERVDKALAPLIEGGDEVDVVVLDPPRSGAGPAVMADILALRPRAVAYVACDPAALARDLADIGEHGYELADLVAYDAFPMTHHVECIATLRRR